MSTEYDPDREMMAFVDLVASLQKYGSEIQRDGNDAMGVVNTVIDDARHIMQNLKQGDEQ